MKLRYTPRAHADLAAIFSAIALKETNMVDATPYRIRQHIERLPAMHASGLPTVEPRVRMVAVDRDPYAIYYAVSADPAEIAILHIRRV